MAGHGGERQAKAQAEHGGDGGAEGVDCGSDGDAPAEATHAEIHREE